MDTANAERVAPPHAAARTSEGVDGRELVVERVVDAPRAMVFRAFTEGDHVAHWFGPFGFRTTTHDRTVAADGRWRFTMHGPDGTDYPNVVRYREVRPGERLWYRHSSSEESDDGFDVVITFTDEGRGTRVTLRQTHPTAERAAEIATYALEGGRQTMARLDGYLSVLREQWPDAVLEGATHAVDDDLVLLRALDGPSERVFRAITEPADLARWFGPGGAGVRVVESSLRAGGRLRYAMKAGEHEAFGRFVYRDVEVPRRLAYVVSFTDERGEPIRHPASATWPLEVLSLVTLTPHGQRTLLAMRSLPIHANDVERATFRAGHDGMRQGFAKPYAQLDELLRTKR